MWRKISITRRWPKVRHFHATQKHRQSNIIDIKNASFYRQYPSDQGARGPNLAIFPNLSFSLQVTKDSQTDTQFWSVLSSSTLARTTFLQVLAGQHISIPPTARTYPYLSKIGKSLNQAVKYVGFDADRGNNVGGTNVRGAYLSARYESRREETDFSLHDYLLGHTELNALERAVSETDKQALDDVVDRLNLRQLLQMPVANLSNGQTRRARIAKALMARPEVLLLDGPFMGLDPNTMRNMEAVLHELAKKESPRLILSLRPEDGVPDWINHLVIADERLRVLAQGAKEQIYAEKNQSAESDTLRAIINAAKLGHNAPVETQLSRDALPKHFPALEPGESLVEMQGVRVAYGDKVVLGDWVQTIDGVERPGLWWSLKRGQRCGIFGANGSGKTTMLSLITSDHPQTYSLPVKLFGRSRLPGPGQPGISLFDIQRRMGHSSPEVHAFFPKQLSVRRVLESAWADAPLSRPKLSSEAQQRINSVLRWFASELKPHDHESTALQRLENAYEAGSSAPGQEQLNAVCEVFDQIRSNDSDLSWSRDTRFGELSFSNQRLLLFLRAIIAGPDLVILDEALSGIDEHTRDRALLFLSHGEKVSKVQGDTAVSSLLSQIQQVSFHGLSSDQALLVISHAKEDVPGCLREWICLPEPGEGKSLRSGRLQGPLELNVDGWDEIWGKKTRT